MPDTAGMLFPEHSTLNFTVDIYQERRPSSISFSYYPLLNKVTGKEEE
jgi:hypothetical protein